MASLTEVLKVARTTRNAFNYWRRARVLSTRFKKTRAGVAGEISRANALEIAFIAAATGVGWTPSGAKPLSQRWLEQEAAGKLPFAVAQTAYSPNSTMLAAIELDSDEGIAEIAYRLGAMTEENYRNGWKDQALYGSMIADDTVVPAPPVPAFTVIYLSTLVKQIDVLFGQPTDR